MTEATTISTRQRDLSQQVYRRLRRERNHRFLRGILMVILVSVGMIVLAISNRDTQAVKTSANIARALADALQQSYDHNGRAARRLPNITLGSRYIRDVVTFNVYYPDQIRTARRVGVCCSKRPLELYLRPSGRHVVLFDGEHYSVEWMPESEFQQRAFGLGLAPHPGATTD